jgi:hypothetical protein
MPAHDAAAELLVLRRKRKTSVWLDLAWRVAAVVSLIKSLRDIGSGLGLRIIRGGTPYGFWRPQVSNLQSGDIIMEIQPTVD